MTFNNIINHLKLWCENQAEAYQKAYEAHGGITYVGYLIAYELEFKLSTLLDKPFKDMEEFEREILTLVDVHYEPSILKPQNSLAQHHCDIQFSLRGSSHHPAPAGADIRHRQVRREDIRKV